MRIRPLALLVAAALVAALPFALGPTGERSVAELTELALREVDRWRGTPEIRVTDGDTLVIGEERIRLFGIDAPELGQTCQDGAREVACGREARTQLERLVRGDRAITCERQGEDRYRRTIARCRRGDGVELNRAMVRQGWALAYRDYGGDAYAAEEAAARADRLGLHALEHETPAEHRRRHR